jgi:hypothetical protein
MSVQPLHRHDRRVVVGGDFSMVFRVLAAIGAAVLIVFSLIALARISWDSNWMDAAPVQVAGVTFTPIVAIGIGVAGVIALLAAASSDRSSKIVVGVLLLCAGVVVLIAQSNSRFTLKAGGNSGRVVLEPAHGWMLVGVGAVLAIAGLATSWRAERAGVDDEIV